MRLSVLFVLSIAAGAAHADATLRYTLAGSDCAVEPTLVMVSGSRLRAQQAGDEAGAVTIYDGIEQTLVALDSGSRTFYSMELDDDALDLQGDVMHATGNRVGRELAAVDTIMQQAMDQAGSTATAEQAQAMAQMQQLMRQQMGEQSGDQQLRQSGLSEAGIAQIRGDALLPAAKTPNWTDLGRDARIGGVDCRMFARDDANGGRIEQCMAMPDALGLDARDSRGMLAGYRRMLRMAANFSGIAATLGAQPAPSDPDGLVVSKVCRRDGSEIGRATLQILREPVDAAAFEVPAGYRAADFGG